MPENTHKVVMDGFGGQGVISAGKFLATAAMNAGLDCAFTPMYGAEVRGGTSHCDVIVSSTQVRSPRIEEPTALILFCKESFEKFKDQIPDHALLIINSSLIENTYTGSAHVIAIDAAALAAKANNPKSINMVLVGAWMGATEAVPWKDAEETVRTISPPKLQKFVNSNIDAMRLGYDTARDLCRANA